MSFEDLASARNHYELRLIDNVVQGRQANQQMASAFSDSMRQQAAAHERQVSEILASNERLAEGTQAMNLAMTEMNDGVGVLIGVVENGLAELAYQHRLTNEGLAQILAVLQRPLDNQAKELRMRAERAFRSGWIDDAWTDFLESQSLNRYDFTVHQALGVIAFLHREDLQAAGEQFSLAAQYAQPESPFDTAYALLSLAAVRESERDAEAALKLADEAVEAAQETCPEAYYARARYRLWAGGDAGSAAADLETALWGNPGLGVVMDSDPILRGQSDVTADALDRVRARLGEIARQRLGRVMALRERLVSNDPPDAPGVLWGAVEIIDSELPRIQQLEARDSIIDYLDAIRAIHPIPGRVSETARAAVQRAAADLRTQAKDVSRAHAEHVRYLRAQADSVPWWGRGWFSFLLTCLACIVGWNLTPAFFSGAGGFTFLFYIPMGLAGLVVGVFGGLILRNSAKADVAARDARLAETKDTASPGYAEAASRLAALVESLELSAQ